MHLKWRNLSEISGWQILSNDVPHGTAPRPLAAGEVTDRAAYVAALAKSTER
jgi:hypothetical protein